MLTIKNHLLLTVILFISVLVGNYERFTKRVDVFLSAYLGVFDPTILFSIDTPDQNVTLIFEMQGKITNLKNVLNHHSATVTPIGVMIHQKSNALSTEKSTEIPII